MMLQHLFRGWCILAQPGLEVAGEGQRQRLARLDVCLLLGEAIPVSVRAGGGKPGGEATSVAWSAPGHPAATLRDSMSRWRVIGFVMR
jgi:hypothetical protein